MIRQKTKSISSMHCLLSPCFIHAKTLVLIICLIIVSFTYSVAQAPPPGQWDASSTNTTISNVNTSVGVGTPAPAGHCEINYCNELENGLVVTLSDCGGMQTSIPGIYATYDGVIDPILQYTGDNGTTFSGAPISFSLGKFDNSNQRPLIWGRTKNTVFHYNGAASSTYTTRFIVTPYGTSGINIEKPRATFDVKSLGDRNDPAAIFGRQVPGYSTITRHVMFVPWTSEDGYNQITHIDDQGIFFTDGLGTGGANANGALVIAPWASDQDPNVGGLRIDHLGNLEVAGTIKTTELTVAQKWWSDFVFRPDYKLRPLSQVDSFVQVNSHLPDVPSQQEIQDKGLDVGQMQAIQMQKIEELYKYVIQLKKENDELKKKVDNLEEQQLKAQQEQPTQH